MLNDPFSKWFQKDHLKELGLGNQERYCPNCKQNVYPTRSLILLILEIILVLAILFWGLNFLGMGQLYVPAAFIFIIGTILSPARKKCPLCKTPFKNLDKKKVN